MTRVFVFPGQGSQAVGMGKELADTYAEAREVFEQVDESVKMNLSKIIFEGDGAALNMTENTQPALMAVSLATIRVLEKQAGLQIAQMASYVAGHSLGEYSALTAVRAFELKDTANLLKLRGKAMQRAVPAGKGAMAAILGLDFDVVNAMAKENAATNEGAVCEAGNDNAPGQVVISGHVAAVESMVAKATAGGAKRAVMLPVSAPFHCQLMAPAAAEMARALAQVTIRPPQVPVVANVTATVEEEPNRIRQLLVDQVTGRVRWRESVLWMAEHGVTEMVELGAGKVLCGLCKRIDGNIKTMNAGTPAEIDALVAHIQNSK